MMNNQDIETNPTSSTLDHFETAKQKLLTFLTQLAETAEGFCNKLRLSFLLCLLASSWLTYFFSCLTYHSSSLPKLSPWELLAIFFGFSLPTLLIWRLRCTLQNVSIVSSIFPAITDCFRQELLTIKNDTLGYINQMNTSQTKRSRLKEFTAMGRQLWGLRKLLTELRSQFGGLKGDVIKSLLAVANPGFVELMGIATACTIILCTLACLSWIFYLFIIVNLR